MPLNRQNTKFFHRHLYAQELETVTLYKRADGQAAGQVRKLVLFDCRWSTINRTGEIMMTDLTIKDARTLHIPRVELDRVGVQYLNPADRFVDAEGRWWEPEAPTGFKVKLFQNHWCVDCLRIDPPNNQITRVTDTMNNRLC